MTLKEKIEFLLSKGRTQQEISKGTGITQSSVSRILGNTQKSVQYEKGKALDSLIEKVSKQTSTT